MIASLSRKRIVKGLQHFLWQKMCGVENVSTGPGRDFEIVRRGRLDRQSIQDILIECETM